MFVVTLVNKGQKFWLHSTTWAFHMDRADRFHSIAAAEEALAKAAKFMHKSMAKKATIEGLAE